MKILILSSKLPFPPKDGGAIATLSLAEGLSDDGNEVHMLCLNTRKHSYDVNQIPGFLRVKIHFYAVDHNTSIRPASALFNLFFSAEPYNAIRFHSNKFEKKLVILLETILPEVVQIEGPYMGYYIPVIRKYSNARISLRAHNVEHEIWQRKTINAVNPFRKYYYSLLSDRIKKLEKKVLGQVDMLIAISERDLNQLGLLHNIKSITIPTGLNTYRYPTPAIPLYPSLFYIGALDWMPNQEGINWFIENVFLQLRKNLPGIELHIAGRNAPSRMKEKLREYKNSGIFYHGEVDNAYEFMNRYAIFVSPLFTGSGIRIKILEGMMMQRAVVATSIAAEGIPVSDRKNIFIADNPEEMIEVIQELCNDREKYESVARNSRHFVIENFNTLATSKRLSEFYRSNQT
ncbi:MAG: glycosyltransferase family 4 protein [Bacteroidales bacterium]|nr:glycosyltransferase family 4 protein [Bacteroidales bacterium]